MLYSYHTSIKIYIHIFPQKSVPRAPSGLHTEDYKIPSIPQSRPYVIKTDAFSLKTVSHRNDSDSMTSPVYKPFHPLFLLILTFSCQGKYLGNVLRTPISQTIKICSETKIYTNSVQKQDINRDFFWPQTHCSLATTHTLDSQDWEHLAASAKLLGRYEKASRGPLLMAWCPRSKWGQWHHKRSS